MNSSDCIGNGNCRQYCEALQDQGVNITITDSGCSAPAMLLVGETGIDFKPKLVRDKEHDDQLIGRLGGALANVLVTETMENPFRDSLEKLTPYYLNAFNARLNLWQGMLGATRSGRKFTDVELDYYEEALVEAETALHNEVTASSKEVVPWAQAAFDNYTLKKYGLLFDKQIISGVNRLVGNMMDGKPTLLVGYKGIAKTQLPKFVSKLWDPEREPVIISGHGDMMSNELIGQMVQNQQTGRFEFKDGKVIQAMTEGRPAILDEVNVGDQSIAMRLQDILLLRAGQKVILQENGGEAKEIVPGFVVFATANEASARYPHRSVLDAAYRDRYDVIELEYPDTTTLSPVEHIPNSLMRLAFAAAVDERGTPSVHLSIPDLESFARLAHISQHLYTTPAKNASVNSFRDSSTSSFVDEEPLMTDCITPRVLVDVIQRCAPGNKPGVTLKSEIERIITSLDQAGSQHNQAILRQAQVLLRTALR